MDLQMEKSFRREAKYISYWFPCLNRQNTLKIPKSFGQKDSKQRRTVTQWTSLVMCRSVQVKLSFFSRGRTDLTKILLSFRLTKLYWYENFPILMKLTSVFSRNGQIFMENFFRSKVRNVGNEERRFESTTAI